MFRWYGIINSINYIHVNRYNELRRNKNFFGTGVVKQNGQNPACGAKRLDRRLMFEISDLYIREESACADMQLICAFVIRICKKLLFAQRSCYKHRFHVTKEREKVKMKKYQYSCPSENKSFCIRINMHGFTPTFRHRSSSKKIKSEVRGQKWEMPPFQLFYG